MIIDTVSYFWINNLLLKEDNPGYLTILPSFKDFLALNFQSKSSKKFKQKKNVILL